MGVGVHDVARLAHVVLQVLPRGAGGQVLHDQLVPGPLAYSDEEHLIKSRKKQQEYTQYTAVEWNQIITLQLRLF